MRCCWRAILFVLTTTAKQKYLLNNNILPALPTVAENGLFRHLQIIKAPISVPGGAFITLELYFFKVWRQINWFSTAHLFRFSETDQSVGDLNSFQTRTAFYRWRSCQLVKNTDFILVSDKSSAASVWDVYLNLSGAFCACVMQMIWFSPPTVFFFTPLWHPWRFDNA